MHPRHILLQREYNRRPRAIRLRVQCSAHPLPSARVPTPLPSPSASPNPSRLHSHCHSDDRSQSAIAAAQQPIRDGPLPPPPTCGMASYPLSCDWRPAPPRRSGREQRPRRPRRPRKRRSDHGGGRLMPSSSAARAHREARRHNGASTGSCRTPPSQRGWAPAGAHAVASAAPRQLHSAYSRPSAPRGPPLLRSSTRVLHSDAIPSRNNHRSHPALYLRSACAPALCAAVAPPLRSPCSAPPPPASSPRDHNCFMSSSSLLTSSSSLGLDTILPC